MKHNLKITAKRGHVWLQFPGGLKYGFDEQELTNLVRRLLACRQELRDERIADEIAMQERAARIIRTRRPFTREERRYLDGLVGLRSDR